MHVSAVHRELYGPPPPPLTAAPASYAAGAAPPAAPSANPSPPQPLAAAPSRRAYPLLPGAAPLPLLPAPVRAPNAKPSAQDHTDILSADVPAILRLRHRIAPAVPGHLISDFSAALLLSLSFASPAAIAADPSSLRLAVSLLQLLPLLTLRHLPSGSLPANVIRSRLHRFVHGDWRLLLEEAWHDAHVGASNARRPPPPPAGSAAATEARLIRAGRLATAHAAAGEYSRAVSILSSDATLADISDSTLQGLATLHPDEPGFKDIAWDDNYFAEIRALATNDITIDSDDVKAVLMNASVRSAGGPSGLTANHLRQPILTDPDLCASAASFFTLLARGAVDDDPACAAILSAGRLLPFRKPNGGLRPIAIGEILRRLCGRCLLRRYAKHARKIFEPLQVGVGSRCGGLAQYHAASAALAATRAMVLITIDLANAFNRMTRIAMFERLRHDDRLRDLLPFIRTFYLRAAELTVADGLTPHTVESRTGSQQGCTFGSLLWSAGWQDALEDFAARTELTVSFIDDGTFVLPAPAAAAFLEHVAAVAAEHGGELNLSKCAALTLDDQELPDDLRALGVRCIDSRVADPAERGLVIHGAPLGSNEFVAAWLDRHLDGQREILRRLSTYVPDRFAAAQMLSYCIVPRIAHLLRALPPAATDSFARAFDDACVKCFTAIAAPDFVDSGLPAAADAKLRLKLRDGGFDIGCQHRSAAAAYVAGWADARPLVLRIAPSLAPHLPANFHVRPAALGPAVPDPAAVPLSPDPADAIPQPIRHLHAAIASLPAESLEILAKCLDRPHPETGAPGRPPPPKRPSGEPVVISHSLQSALSRPSHTAYKASFVSNTLAGDAVARAIHRSQAGFLGTAWFQRLNVGGPQHIDNKTFVTAVALHLCLPIAAFEGLRCPCGAPLTASSGPLHIQSCCQFAKLPRSETFQHAFDSIILDVGSESGGVRIAGAQRKDGVQVACAPYAHAPVLRPDNTPAIDPLTGVARTRAIIPDRVVSEFRDDKVGPSGRYIIDTVVVAPECSSHIENGSANSDLAAAKSAYAEKYKTYSGHLKTGDILLPVACETWGGLHEVVEKRLREWADFLFKVSGGEAVFDDREGSLSAAYLAVWRMRLSAALLHGRVQLVTAALAKIEGVPARTQLLAHRISHPWGFVREAGRLRRRW